jgi:uncharacterized protein related to proFAR isomerase
MAINKKTSFSIEGFRALRNNPDGTPASPDRILGFSGTVDLSAIVGNSADITIKLDDGSEDTQTIDWTAAVDKTAVTVAEMFAAINAAGFTDITASADVTTGRLLVVYDGSEDISYMQLYNGDSDNLATLLDFGQGHTHDGEGVKFVRAFDNSSSIGLPKNIKDREEIEAEAGDGTLLTIIVPAIIKGLNPTITNIDNDLELKQLIQGGTYNSTTNTYTPPNTSVTTKPIFSLEIFAPVYSKGTNQKEDLAGYERIFLPSCTGIEGDVTKETRALASYLFNLSATEYTDESDVKHAAWIEQILSQTEFDALDVENV